MQIILGKILVASFSVLGTLGLTGLQDENLLGSTSKNQLPQEFGSEINILVKFSPVKVVATQLSNEFPSNFC